MERTVFEQPKEEQEEGLILDPVSIAPNKRTKVDQQTSAANDLNLDPTDGTAATLLVIEPFYGGSHKQVYSISGIQQLAYLPLFFPSS